MTPIQRLALALATVLDRLPALPRRKRKPEPNPLITGGIFIFHTGTDPERTAHAVREHLERHQGRRGGIVA